MNEDFSFVKGKEWLTAVEWQHLETDDELKEAVQRENEKKMKL
jgi:hypothetical protein